MDSSYDLLRYFPLRYVDQSLANSVVYHAQHLDLSLEHGIESGVFFHTHILYMTFVYIQILRISQIKDRDFKYSWILSSQENDFLKIMNTQKSPFAFHILNERTVFRFFRLLDFDENLIRGIKKCVDERNDFAHANGEYIQNLDQKLEGYISNMQKITDKSSDFLKIIYDKFISENQSLLEPGYKIQDYDIEGSLLTPYYVSEYEVQKIITFDNNAVIDGLKANYEVE